MKKAGLEDGICIIFVPHTTAAVTINENADPTVRADIVNALNRIVPWRGNYAYTEGNSAAHIKASLFGQSTWVLVAGGRVQLGTWQGSLPGGI